MFISFEGPEGAGKTTQIKLLVDFLKEKGCDVVLSREPGGTALAEKIRSILITRDAGNWDPLSEVLLLYTGRLEHVKNVILPALKAGKVVISDRFSDSTKAYQGYGRGVDMDVIEKIEDIAINGFKPDLTFIMDIDVEKGLARTKDRFTGNNDNSGSTEDRFEREHLSFHQKLRKGYLDIAEKDKKRCVVLQADGSIEEIQQKIQNEIKKRFF